eukprot:gene17784-24159_t
MIHPAWSMGTYNASAFRNDCLALQGYYTSRGGALQSHISIGPMSPRRAKASDLAIKIPSPLLHFYSLANAMGHIRSNMANVLYALHRWEDSEWPLVEDTVAR